MNSLNKIWRSAKRLLRNRVEAAAWRRRRFEAPSPQSVKWAVLNRHAIDGAQWVETGTYLGDTTDFLSRRASFVFSIEPEGKLYAVCRERFKNYGNVQIVHGTSEQVLKQVVAPLSGNVCFWLDGHASGGVTFAGPLDTPVMHELAVIAEAAPQFSNVAVLVDDVRCFDPTIKVYSGYPPRDALVEWAIRNGFAWHIEHDIFVAKKGGLATDKA